jgi:formylglycine-generating enzyme required for sulfatase activity
MILHGTRGRGKKLVLLCSLLLAACFPVRAQQNASAPQKYALVIGNGAYTGITRLNNPENDAADMKAVLEGLGWTVDLVRNGTLDQMESAAGRLKNRLSVSRDSYGFFFYAGHGVQSNGENYLIPVDAAIQSENLLRQRAMSVQYMLDELNSAGNALNIVVLDACRDNPFSWRRSGSRGLALTANQPADSIIVYATAAGSTAQDGTGRNGLFTGHLLDNLKKPGLSIRDVFDRTGADVQRASGRAQVPAVYSQFFGVAYLGNMPAVSPPHQPVPAPVRPAVTPPERPAPSSMVYVEGGTFQMGSTNGNSNEKPVHTVTVKSFYMGRTEVTQKEWREVMENNPSAFKGDNLPVENISWYEAVEYCTKLSLKEGLTPAYRGSGDAIACDFNASGYRLPTEAEWEYAAKGGAKDYLIYEYAGSNNVDGVAWYSGNSGNTTRPVGTKQPNSLGLYDMSGNVWEWCWDWYGSYGGGNQTNPAGASSGTYRVERGGSWFHDAAYVRSAFRNSDTPSSRYYALGFRLVRP